MTTKIEWTEETWNPIIGCSKVSPGCDNCYAERMAKRLANIESSNYYRAVTCRTVWDDPGTWNGETYLVESALEKPLHWKKPRTIFVCSMGDLFHESVPFEWIDRVMDVMQDPTHTYLLLTKRPDRMLAYFKYFGNQIKEAGFDSIPSRSIDPLDYYSPLQNMWLGVTAENQEQADKRIPILLQIPAAKHFVSIEPLLGPVDLEDIKYPDVGGESHINSLDCDVIPEDDEQFHGATLDWVICGGESGPGARPVHPD